MALDLALRNAATLRWLSRLPPGARDLVAFDYAREKGIPVVEVEDVEDEYMDLDWVYATYKREIEA